LGNCIADQDVGLPLQSVPRDPFTALLNVDFALYGISVPLRPDAIPHRNPMRLGRSLAIIGLPAILA